MKTVIEVLTEARAKVEHGWCKRQYAVDAKGHGTGPTARDACCWCVMGAVYAVAGSEYVAGSVRMFLFQFIGEFNSIGGWNDWQGRTQDEVVDLFTRAIAKAQEGTA